jgi:hypothetical protein
MLLTLVRLGCYNKSPQMGGLTEFYSSQVWRLEVKVLADLLWFAYGHLLLIASHGQEWTEKASSHVSSYKDTSPIQGALHLRPNHLPKLPPPNTLGVRILTYDCGGEINIQFIIYFCLSRVIFSSLKFAIFFKSPYFLTLLYVNLFIYCQSPSLEYKHFEVSSLSTLYCIMFPEKAQ